MSALLLILGGVTAVAGLALAGSGFSIHERTFDPEFVTAGTIAVVGGLILVGMGIALFELRRIALIARPASSGARLPEPAETVAEAPPRIPSPPKAKAIPQAGAATPPPVPPPVVPPPLVPPSVEVASDQRAKFPALVPVESAPVVEAAEISLTPPPAPVRVDEHVVEVRDVAAAASRGNGAAPMRSAPRLEMNARTPAGALQSRPVQAKGSVLNTIWPTSPRRDVRSGPASAAVSAPPVPSASPEVAPPAAVADGHYAEPVSVLKSGVVEGMAYTLYSDGSIEAQLPQGTLRFGSIAALRSHIESAS